MLLKYFIIFISGGSIVTLVSFLSQKNLPILAGVIILIPGISLVSYLSVGYLQTSQELQEVVFRSMFGLFAFAMFLVSMYFCLNYFQYKFSCFIAFGAWVLAAGLMVFVQNYFDI